MEVNGVKKNEVDLTQIKAGLERKTIDKDAKMASIFDSIDGDKNGVLDESEIKKFKEALDGNKNDIANKKEANKYIKEHNLKKLKVKKNDLIKFLQKYGENAENVQDVQNLENGAVQITYKDNSQKIVNEDKSYDTIETNSDKSKVTKSYDEKDVLKKELVETEETITETTYAEDGKTKVQTTENNLVDNTSSLTNYNDKGEIETTIKHGSAIEIIEYENGKPATKEVRQGSTVSNFEYLEDGSERITHKVENKGNDALERTTEYTYNEDGSFVEDIKQEGTQTHVVNTCNSDGHRLAQTKTVGEKEYSAKYDGEGNTEGVVIQNKETIEQIAEKFGCSVEDLQKLNGKEKFAVGDTIKVPGEIEADKQELQGRKTSEEAKAEEQKDIELKAKQQAEAQRRAEIARQRRAQRALEDAQLKPLGLKNRNGAGAKVEGRYKNGSKVTLTKVGNAVNERTICKDKSGKYYVVSHDGMILKTDYVQATTVFANGTKVKGKMKDKNGNIVTKQFAEVPGAEKDAHGRKLVVDSKGRVYYMAQDGTILKNEYVAKSNHADAIKADKQVARTATLDMLEQQLDAAQAAFDQQMDRDGWAADVADGISYIWNNDLFGGGTGNTARQVRQDLAAYRNTIAELKQAASKGDAVFEATFEKKFGIKYNQAAVADYLMNPTEANYRKAFGTKQPIGERVAKYNQSQETGAGVVKVGAEIGGAIALTAAAIATGGAAAAAAAPLIAGGAAVVSDVVVETTDRASSNQGLQEGEMTEILEDAAIDGVITAATMGAAKGLQKGYKGYKAYKAGNAAYKASKAAAKVEVAAVKAENAAVQAEKALAKAEAGAAKAEAGAAKAEAGAAKAEAGAAKAEAGAAKAEAGAAKAEAGAAKAEAGAEKAEAGAEKAATAESKTTTAGEKVNSEVAANSEASAQQAETTAAQVESESSAQQAANADLTKVEVSVIDTVANVGVGVGVEYGTTGDVTVLGVTTNAVIGSSGLVGEKLAPHMKKGMQKAKNGISNAFHKAEDKATSAYQSVKEKIKNNLHTSEGSTNNARGTNGNSRASEGSQGATQGNRADGANQGNRADGANQGNRADGANQGNRANGANQGNRADGASQGNRADGASQSHAEQGRRSGSHDDMNINSMSDQEIKNAIDELQPKLKEAQCAADIKEEFADVLSGNLPMTPESFKKTYRKMVVKAHPDKGGSNEIIQCINNLNDEIKKGNSVKIKRALAELNAAIDSRSSMLETYKTKMNTYTTAADSRKAKAAESQKEAQSQANTEEKASAQSENRQPTTEEKIKMGELGNDINRAKTREDFAKLQNQLDKMPECTQKSRLQAQLNEKASKINIDPQYRATSDEFIPDELVREVGNNGNPINENYIQASKDLREHYKKAIADGTYADSYENYVKTITEGHKVAYGGFDGQHTWYGDVGQGYNSANPGQIRGKGKPHSERVSMGEQIEEIARKYGDKYSTHKTSKINLDGIPKSGRPENVNVKHYYPDGKYMSSYFKQMQRTAKEAVTLIDNKAPQDEILAKLAEHYQYAANARPFGQINNSLFMNEINTLLQKAGMKPMPHGILDHVAQRLQPDAFKRYFIDEYKKTALSA